MFRRAARIVPNRETQYLRSRPGLLVVISQVGVNRQDRKTNVIAKESE